MCFSFVYKITKLTVIKIYNGFSMTPHKFNHYGIGNLWGGDLVVTSVMAIIFIPGLNVCRKDENNFIAKFVLKNKFRHVTYEVK